MSPFKLGYDYYNMCKKHQGNNECVEKNILVHTKELELAFSEHLPGVKNVDVHDRYQWHQQSGGTAKEDIWRPIIDMIEAHFENDVTSETIDNLLASFLEAFFRILEIKSLEKRRPSANGVAAGLGLHECRQPPPFDSSHVQRI